MRVGYGLAKRNITKTNEFWTTSS